MYATHALENLSAPDLDHFLFFCEMCPWASHPCKKCAPELKPGAPDLMRIVIIPKNGYINSLKIRGTIPPDCAQINGNGDQGEAHRNRDNRSVFDFLRHIVLFFFSDMMCIISSFHMKSYWHTATHRDKQGPPVSIGLSQTLCVSQKIALSACFALILGMNNKSSLWADRLF